MEKREFLVVGAGVSGLAFANEVRDRVLVLEREEEPGGWCRTVKQDGFVWDYSGHFFHFRRPEIDAWLRERMPANSVRTVEKRTRVTTVAGDEVDFPFQTHLHQLPQPAFVACLADWAAAARAPGAGAGARSFKDMLERRFGRAVCDSFLVPYNEKVYATDLDRLDKDAMGRFFPQASLEDALAALGGARLATYNDTFTYPKRGAVQYVRALMRDLPEGAVALGEGVERVDVDRRVVHTKKGRQIGYEHLVASAPLPSLLRACGVAHDADAFTSNQVLVLNLGFDRKGRDDVHWIYFADPALSLYRVGFYDNILGTDRMSLYVEIGMPAGADVDVDAARARALADLARAGVVDGHRLVASHAVVMNPAYAHITRRSLLESARTRAALADLGVHAVGRYGRWTYCSIEDNIVEARALARALAGP